MINVKIDMTGWKMWEHGVENSHWTILGRAENSKGGKVRWICQCDCEDKTIQTVQANHIRDGKSLQCQKCAHKITGSHNSTHRETDSRLYNIWSSMKGRCNNPNDQAYERYGQRGISVCFDWNNSYENFRDWALSHGYKNTLSIDRIDNNGNYCPENCKWATEVEQANNRSNNRYITYNNQTHTLTEWEKITGLKRGVIAKRIDKHGWSIEKALTTPSKQHKINEENKNEVF
jgi:hypothetical protein